MAAGPLRLLINDVGNRQPLGRACVLRRRRRARAATCSAPASGVVRAERRDAVAARARRTAATRRPTIRACSSVSARRPSRSRVRVQWPDGRSRGVGRRAGRSLDDADAGQRPVKAGRPCGGGVRCLPEPGWAACRSSQARNPPARIASPDRATLAAVTLPDLSRVDRVPSRRRSRERYAVLEQRRAAPGTSDADLAVAYGEYGDAAARGRVLRGRRARLSQCAGAATRRPALAVLPGASLQVRRRYRPGAAWPLHACAADCARTIWRRWSGWAACTSIRAQPDRPSRCSRRPQAATPRTVAAVAGLGQVALARTRLRARGDAARGRRSRSIHGRPASTRRWRWPIAASGDTAQAESHLKQWRNTEVPVADPLRDELAPRSQSGLSYELRGVRALDRRRLSRPPRRSSARAWTLTPGTDSAGTLAAPQARYGAGAERRHARRPSRASRRSIRLAPPGGLDEPAGQGALQSRRRHGRRRPAAASHRASDGRRLLQPELPGGAAWRWPTRCAAPAASRRRSRSTREAVRINPRAGRGAFRLRAGPGQAAPLRRGARLADESVRVQPDRPELAHALARLLATAPDARVRDGQRAAAMVKELLAHAPEHRAR